MQRLTTKDILTSNAFGRRMNDKYQKVHKKSGWFYQKVTVNGDGLSDPSSHEVTDLTPKSGNYLYDPSHEEFLENDSQSVTQPQKPVTNPSLVLNEEDKFEELL